MDASTKQCPLCAEDIPLAAAACPYCPARFVVTRTGYCQGCHEVRGADEAGCCAVCGSALLDWHLESQFIEELIPIDAPTAAAAPSPLPSMAGPPAMIQARKNLWLYVALAGIVILVAGAALLLGRSRIPVVAGLFATRTPTATHTTTPTLTPTPQPTATLTLSPTPTITPTPLPGEVVIPIETMVSGIPWLPVDKVSAQTIFTIGIDVTKPPFDDPLVRQALAAALDRQALAQIAKQNGARIIYPATSFTPAEVLGRDLYGQVGIPYNPERARSLLAQAGYAAGAGFPAVSIGTNRAGLRLSVVEAAVNMWQEVLGVTIKVEALGVDEWNKSLEENTYPLHRVSWYGDQKQDPNELLLIYTSGHQPGITFSNAEFDALIDQAARLTDPLARQALYIQAERILCEVQVPVIPLFSYGE